MHAFSKYKERFVPSNQSDMLDIIENDEKMFQEYKKAFNREKIDGICKHLCDYIILNDLLIDKETFSKAFKEKGSLIRNLTERIQSCDITLCEEYRQRSFISSRYLKERKEREKLSKRIDQLLNSTKETKGECFTTTEKLITEKTICKHFALIDELMKEMKDSNNNPMSFYKLTLKKPEMLTIENLKSLSVIDGDNNYKKISFQSHDRKKDGHALLIKKNSDDDFTFYDPNYGAVFDLTKDQLCELITQTFYSYKNTTTNMVSVAARLFSFISMIIHSISPEPLIPATLLLLYCSRLTSQKYDTVGDTNINLHELERQSLNTEQKNMEDVHVQPITSISQTSAR